MACCSPSPLDDGCMFSPLICVVSPLLAIWFCRWWAPSTIYGMVTSPFGCVTVDSWDRAWRRSCSDAPSLPWWSNPAMLVTACRDSYATPWWIWTFCWWRMTSFTSSSRMTSSWYCCSEVGAKEGFGNIRAPLGTMSLCWATSIAFCWSDAF